MNGVLTTGRSGNAAALGSMPVPDGAGGSVQLLDVASLSELERRLVAARADTSGLWESTEDWDLDPAVLAGWVKGAAAGLAHVAASAGALLDLQALVVDGWMPDDLRQDLVLQTRAALQRIDLSGATAPDVLPGTIGAGARALGAAAVPLARRFMVSPSALGA